ncbi:hypothetical protein, partial [Actinopolymorpha pittospori]|uniref:hypothetical protein n=1 Tax=Actinopolymorpha pittospori TaxID=648752 RepID=UPI0031EF5F6E
NHERPATKTINPASPRIEAKRLSQTPIREKLVDPFVGDDEAAIGRGVAGNLPLRKDLNVIGHDVVAGSDTGTPLPAAVVDTYFL